MPSPHSETARREEAGWAAPAGASVSAASGEPIAARPGLPVLFMSGYAEELLADSSPGAEGVNIHDKPCTVARLSAAVREAMNPQR